MNQKQYRAALDKLEMTQATFAELLGLDARTSRRYALGERAVPHAVAILLNMLVDGTLTAEQIKATKR